LKYTHEKSELEKAKIELSGYLNRGAESMLKGNVELDRHDRSFYIGRLDPIMKVSLDSQMMKKLSSISCLQYHEQQELSSEDNQTNKLKVLGSGRSLNDIVVISTEIK